MTPWGLKFRLPKWTFSFEIIVPIVIQNVLYPLLGELHILED